MKKIRLFIMIFFCVWNIQAQKSEEDLEINRDYAAQMQTVFGELEKDRIPHGILAEYAFPFADLNAYNGTLTDSTAIDVEVFSSIYKALMMGRVHAKTEVDFEDMKVVAKRWGDYRKNLNANPVADRSVVVLSGLLYSYASIPEESFRTGKISHKGNTVQDVYFNGVWQNPYVEKETVAITPPLSDFNTHNLSVMLPSDLFLTNQKEKLNIQADFSDGKGLRPFSVDSLIPIDYVADGRYDWIFKIDRNGRMPLKIKVPILINNAQSVSATNVVIPNGQHTAVLRISHAPGHNKKIMKPLIIAEGFDAGSILSPEKMGGDTTLINFMNSIVNAESLGLSELLRGTAQEYDIIYVDWENGIGDIRQNAVTLEKVIEWVNGQKQVNGSTEPNVLLGQSMGGLISRYTLVKMEQKNKTHDVRLFVAHDSPFQGANTPVSAQMLSRHLLKVYLSNPVATTIMEILIPFVQGYGQLISSDFLQEYVTPYEALTIQDTPAALQMTKYHIKRDYSVSISVQTAFQAEMDALGYPQQSRNIAISNGNLCGLNNGYDGGESLFLLDETGSGKNVLTDILRHLGTSIWGFTSGNVKLGLVALIPGKSKIDYLIDLKAIPEENVANRIVYRGKARYHVVLWRIGSWRPTVSTDIVPLRQLSVANLYPMETFAGGISSMKSVAGEIDFFPIPEGAYINPRYGFVSVASALDIKANNNAVLTVSDNRRGYSNQQALVSNNLHTLFHNFITERITGNHNNFSHISFSPRNGEWLAQELNGNEGIAQDCSFVCDNYKLKIEGNSLLCSSNIYTSPTNADAYIWTIEHGADLVNYSGNGTPSLTLKRKNNRNGLVRLSLLLLSESCGNKVLERELWVGKPEVFIMSDRYHNRVDATLIGTGNSGMGIQQIEEITWERLPNRYPRSEQVSFQSSVLTAKAKGPSAAWRIDVKVTVSNACGTSSTTAALYSEMEDDGSGMMYESMFELEEVESSPYEYELVKYEFVDEVITRVPLFPTDRVMIYVYNLNGQKLLETKESRINLANLNTGTYILNAIINDDSRAELKVYKR